MSCLVTLDDLRRHLGLRADETADDARLLTAIEAASDGLERECGRWFEPRFAALPHTLPTASDTLSLAHDLLALTALSDAGGGLPLDTVERIPASGPAALLRLNDGLRFMAGTVLVTGWWGWADDPASLWQTLGQAVQDDPLHGESTQMTVADLSLFSPGQLLKVGDELLRVMDVPLAPGPIAVQRGRHGTTAASHAQGAPVYSYSAPPDVRDLVLRRAAWLTRRPDPLPDLMRAPALRWRRERV